MRRAFLILLLASSVGAAGAQTSAKPSTHSATSVKPAGNASRVTATSTGTKVPAGVPAAKGPVKTAFSLRYQDIKIGTGADAEPGKIFKVHYTGWLGANGRADDGRKFDSSYDHRPPLMDKDGKPQLGDDGKPKLGEPQPITFIQGMGRAIPGFDQGFAGMKVGGKRRIFIPWQLAYGARGRPGPDAAHPGIPPKSDLIFDVELVDVTEMAMPPNHPPMGVVHMPATQEHPATAQPGTRAQPSTQAHPEAQSEPAAHGQPETPAKTETPAQPK